MLSTVDVWTGAAAPCLVLPGRRPSACLQCGVAGAATLGPSLLCLKVWERCQLKKMNTITPPTLDSLSHKDKNKLSHSHLKTLYSFPIHTHRTAKNATPKGRRWEPNLQTSSSNHRHTEETRRKPGAATKYKRKKSTFFFFCLCCDVPSRVV